MKIIHTVADLQPESGGPSRSVSSLAQSVAAAGAQVQLLAMEYGEGAPAPLVPVAPVCARLVPCHGALLKKLKWAKGFSTTLRQALGTSSTLLHDHGLWLPTNHCAAKTARRLGTPLVVSPRGMLAQHALRFSGFKKRLAWRLYQCGDLQSATLLHATCPGELDSFRTAGLRQPVAVVPNGVEIPNAEAQKSEIQTKAPLSRTILFVGRIHPIKRLKDLVGAWAIHKVRRNQQQPRDLWRIVVAGNDESGHLAEVEEETRRQNVEGDFEFVGPVHGEKKWELYRNSDVFILPSYSENFGIVVAEALAAGVPVITTRGTPWEELQTHRCGWWVDTGPEALAAALDEATRLTDEERRAMGQRGRCLVEQRYSWSRIGQQMFSVYQWILGQGPRPDCVLL